MEKLKKFIVNFAVLATLAAIAASVVAIIKYIDVIEEKTKGIKEKICSCKCICKKEA